MIERRAMRRRTRDYWSLSGAGPDAPVAPVGESALLLVESALALAVYAGGFFTTAGGGSASNIARWDGTAWCPLGAGVNATVLALAVDPGAMVLVERVHGQDGLGIYSYLRAVLVC